MADPSTPVEAKLSKLEHLKENSRQLRGTIAEELQAGVECFNSDNLQLLKHHGSYQQDDRDRRNDKDADGNRLGKRYMFMVRTRIPGGKVTADDFLKEFNLCEEYGNGTLRITSRQGFQLHGVLMKDLKETIRGINQTKLSTIAACGDVSRNTMCCPAPFKNNTVRDDMQAMADTVAEHLKPKTTAYYEIWLTDEETGESEKVEEFVPVDEPVYGKRYLPRKFKVGFALPEDNCIDVYSQDLGFLAVVENEKIVGYNVLVGGSMGMTPAKKETFPAVAERLTYVTPDQVVSIADAIVKVQRDFGNREDRKQARMKYLIANWGLPKFKAKVEEYYGSDLPEPHPTDVTDVDDHLGWHEQGDGKWFLGVCVPNGRIQDENGVHYKSAIREILTKYGMETRLTALQDVIFCDIEAKDREDITQILKTNNVPLAENLTLLKRYAMACPALPTCGLAVTESERVAPDILADIEKVMDKHGLIGERIALHMTGCPNGCARPYAPDIGLVGKAKFKYTLYLGGNAECTRLGFIYDDLVPQKEIAQRLDPVLQFFKSERQNGESFGDFCHRQGKENLANFAATA